MITMVTVAEVEKAQQAWGRNIVAIATAHRTGGNYVQLAREHIETLYAYDTTTVLFKPTLATIEQFRPTFDGALSYFVASNNQCPEDKGFAIKGWTKVRFENADIIVEETTALAMGNYFFTTPENDEIKVEYTFGYVMVPSGNLKIQLHHSSIPATQK